MKNKKKVLNRLKKKEKKEELGKKSWAKTGKEEKRKNPAKKKKGLR